VDVGDGGGEGVEVAVPVAVTVILVAGGGAAPKVSVTVGVRGSEESDRGTASAPKPSSIATPMADMPRSIQRSVLFTTTFDWFPAVGAHLLFIIRIDDPMISHSSSFYLLGMIMANPTAETICSSFRQNGP
jgi:hypothetical protein